jgi:hypothetical protein
MPFPHKGENHANGIKNEKDIVEYQNSNPTNTINKYFQNKYPGQTIKWEHKGGTVQKKDAIVEYSSGKTIGISIKNHKSGGTFDWDNTTKGVPEALQKEINDFKSKSKDIDIPISDSIKDEIACIFSKHLEMLSSDQITNILDHFYQKEPDTNHILVNDRKKKKYILFEMSNFDPYFNPKHKHTFILKSTKAKTSRQIWVISKDGFEVNTNLRIRMHLNNGATSLFTKSSTPCIKIQQDKVDEFISKCFGKVIVPY